MSTRATVLTGGAAGGPWPALHAVLSGCRPDLALTSHAAPARRAAAARPRPGAAAARGGSRAGDAGGRSLPGPSLLSLAVKQPDLVLCEGYGARGLQAAVYRWLRPRSRLLLWAPASAGPTGPLGRFALARADVVLAAGEAAAQAIRGLGVPASRVVSVPEPLDVGRFLAGPAARSGAAAHRLVHVGDLSPRAGVLDILLCAAEWAERNRDRALEIWWAGEGDLRGVLEAQPIPANLSQRFLGEPDEAALRAAFAECGLLVAPALADGGASRVAEALAAGLPVVGSVRCRAVADLVADGETGWVFDPLAPGAMAAALDRALGTAPPALDAMREAARARVRARSAQGSAEWVGRAVAVALRGGAPKDGG